MWSTYFRPAGAGVIVGFPFYKAGQEYAVVPASFNEYVNCITISIYTRTFYFAKTVRFRLRFKVRLRPTFHGLMKGLFGVVYPQGYCLYPVAVLVNVPADFSAAFQRGSQHQPDLALLHHVRFAVFEAGSQAGVGQRLEAKGRFVEVGGLFGIAHVQFDVVGSVQRQEVFSLRDYLRDCGCGLWGHGLFRLRLIFQVKTVFTQRRKGGTQRVQGYKLLTMR